MSVEHQSLVMPSSPDDRKRVAGMMREMVNCMTRIKSEQEAKKDILNRIVEEFDLPKNIVAKAATTMFKEEQQKVMAEYDDLETFLETLNTVIPATGVDVNDAVNTM